MASPQQPPVDPFAGFPFHILSRIARHVDCYTMRNLLIASRTVRDNSVVLFENSDPLLVSNSFLFLLPEIPYFPYSNISKVYAERPHAFKLIDVVSGINPLEGYHSHTIQNDLNTFVHYRTSVEYNNDVCAYGNGHRVRVNWYGGDKELSVYGESVDSNRSIEVSTFEPRRFDLNKYEVTRLNPFKSIPGLRSLNCSLDSDFMNYDFPSLTELTLHFCQPSKLPELRLTVSGIHAPLVRSLVIRYSGTLPYFSDNTIGDSFDRGRLLEFTNVPSTLLTKTEYLINDFTFKYNYSSDGFADLFKNFEFVVLRGVPQFLITFLPESVTLRHLIWINNVKYSEFAGASSDKFTCSVARISERFSVINSVPEMSLPRFTIMKLNVKAISIYTYAPRFNLSSFFKRKKLDFMTSYLLSSPKSVIIKAHLPSSLFGQHKEYITLSKDDLLTIFSFEDLAQLILEGCYFGDETNRLLRKTPSHLPLKTLFMECIHIGILPAPKGTIRPDTNLLVELFGTTELHRGKFFVSVFEMVDPEHDPRDWVYYRSVTVKLHPSSYLVKHKVNKRVHPLLTGGKLKLTQ